MRNLIAQRVVVTGAGVVTALGLGWAANARGFAAGTSGFRPVTRFDVSRHRCRMAAEVDLPGEDSGGRITGARWRRMDRAGQLLLLAAREAAGQALLPERVTGEPTPLVVATTSAGMASGEEFFRRAKSQPGSRRGQAVRLANYFVTRQLREVAEDLGLPGPFVALSNACASGANAIGHAWELLRFGRAEIALAGGYDALSELVFSGFDALQALSTTMCRPFDRDRDGLGLGEGAAVLVLETLEHARRRGARVLGELAGYGVATDLHHLTQPQPEGKAALASMDAACRAAGVGPREVGYLNAHGTGTPLNDAAEAHAVNAWAGGDAEGVAVSSTKAAVGHLLGAAGAVEAVVSLMVLREQWLPPMPGLREADPVCRFPLVRAPRRAGNVEVVVSNSFGFGGSNATLVFRRWHD